ncbi:MAG: hypothetical protein U9M95_00615 [Candidatus Altiarchaeota archaeon]|nr:hypothetical protein [Candidatus Altiarchaeota archaeon]
MKKYIILGVVLAVMLSGCIDPRCTEGDELISKETGELTDLAFNSSGSEDYPAIKAKCDQVVLLLDSYSDCYSDYSESRSILSDFCDGFEKCKSVAEELEDAQRQYRSNMNKTGRINYSGAYHDCIAFIEAQDAYFKCMFNRTYYIKYYPELLDNYSIMREKTVETCNNYEKCITSDRDMNKSIDNLIKTFNTTETNTDLMKKSCDETLAMLEKYRSCYNDTEDIVAIIRTFCGYDAQPNICEGFPNSDFEGDLARWYPYIHAKEGGRIVDESHPDFELVNDPFNGGNSKSLKIINNNPEINFRSSISHRLALNSSKLDEYTLSYRIYNPQDLKGRDAQIYARIYFLDNELNPLCAYYWFYFDNPPPFRLDYPDIHYENFGHEKDSYWRTVSIKLSEAAEKALPSEKIKEVRGIRFSSGVFNQDKSSITMYLDDIKITCT